MTTTSTRQALALAVAATLLCQTAPSAAQDPAAIESGRSEFGFNCAVCHGTAADGQGPMAGLMKERPPDLTRLSERNGGVFPFMHVVETIDGRFDVGSHGTKDMPVWGIRFREGADPGLARARIFDLTLYLDSIQVE